MILSVANGLELSRRHSKLFEVVLDRGCALVAELIKERAPIIWWSLDPVRGGSSPSGIADWFTSTRWGRFFLRVEWDSCGSNRVLIVSVSLPR